MTSATAMTRSDTGRGRGSTTTAIRDGEVRIGGTIGEVAEGAGTTGETTEGARGVHRGTGIAEWARAGILAPQVGV